MQLLGIGKAALNRFLSALVYLFTFGGKTVGGDDFLAFFPNVSDDNLDSIFVSRQANDRFMMNKTIVRKTDSVKQTLLKVWRH